MGARRVQMRGQSSGDETVLTIDGREMTLTLEDLKELHSRSGERLEFLRILAKATEKS